MSKKLFGRKTHVKRAVFILVYLISLVLMMEVVSRAYLVVKYGLPFLSPNDIVFVYYPELREPSVKQITHKDGNINILLLGGSVLSKKWSSIESRLREKVKSKTKRNVNIYNLAIPAHSSLDSYYKYRYLQDKHFDLVVFYHGINEVRANNCPPSIFKEDYSHYSWYERVNLVFNSQKELEYITFLWNIRSLILDLKYMLFKTKYVPAEIPLEEWIDYGGDIKTRKSFENNITRILNIAKNK